MSRNEKGQFAAGAPSERRKQWVGNRYGKLLVTDVEYGVKRGSKTRTICTCVCDCGNTIQTVADYLQQGTKTSCGCDTMERRIQSNRVDLTGRRFGRLVVLEMLWVKPHTKCRCICDCGNEAIVTNAQLTYGKTTSCGCVQRERTSQANTKDFTGQRTESGIVFLRKHKKVGRGVWEWECECPICHETFYGIPAVLRASGQLSCGCAGTSVSAGEVFVECTLQQLGANYVHNYMTEECKNIKMLRFDFAILDSNGNPSHMIEYDGRQHFEPIEYFGGEEAYQGVVHRDEIKNNYCKEKGISMIRLPYTMSYDEIREIIKNIINP